MKLQKHRLLAIVAFVAFFGIGLVQAQAPVIGISNAFAFDTEDAQQLITEGVSVVDFTLDTTITARSLADFDQSGCTNIFDFLFLLDHWGMVTVEFGAPAISVPDFLSLLDNWHLGPNC